MANKIEEILDGVDVRKVLEKPGLSEAVQFDKTAYDNDWLESVHKEAAKVFGADSKLWDLMAFAPREYFRDELQDALNAYSVWYQKFIKIKKEKMEEE